MNSKPPSLLPPPPKKKFQLIIKHARLLEIGLPQIWKPMKLSQQAKRTQQLEEEKPKMAENICSEVAEPAQTSTVLSQPHPGLPG